MKKQPYLKSIYRIALVALCLMTAGVGQMWGSNAHHCLIGDPITTWKASDQWSKSYEQFALTSPANSNYDEFCAYMWIEKDQTFAFNNHFFNAGEAKQVGPGTDKATLYNNAGTGQGVATDGTTNAYQYTGSTGLVKVCAAQSSGSNNQGEWKPYVWVEESKETEILKGNKIMFYFGMTTSWNEDWNVLRTSNTTDITADQQYHRLPESKCSSYISVAYVSPAQYYVGKTAWAGVQMAATAEAGCLYSVYNNGSSDVIYKNVADGAIPHFSKTTLDTVYGTTDSKIAATVSNSIYGNKQNLYYYYTTDNGETFTHFDPSDISDLTAGTYKVYALAFDGHIMVKSDNYFTLTISNATITLNENGGTKGAGFVSSIIAKYGAAASTGNIRVEAKLPTKEGNGFDGYWTQAVGGIQVISEWGEWKSGVAYWTDAEGKWIRTTSEKLYAHWRPVGYYVVGDFNSWQADSILSGSPLTSKTAFFWKNTLKSNSYKSNIKVREVKATPLTDVWYGCTMAAEMNESHTSQIFYKDQSNVSLEMKYNGVYQFQFDASTKELSVTIPITNQLQIYESDPWDLDRHHNVNWRADMSEHKVDKTVVLKKATTYNFKAVYKSDYWGKATDDTIKSSSTSLTGLTCTGTEKNMHVKTTLTGNYTFELDTNLHKMTVTYPTARRITCTQSPAASADAPTIVTTDGNISVASGEDVCDGTSITFTHAAAKTGYTWSGWYDNAEGTGDALGTGDTYTATASGALTVYAVYTENSYTVTVAATTGGSVTTPDSGSPRTVSAHVTTTTAIAADSTNAAYRFVKWTSSSDKVVFANANARSTTITTSEAATVTANFEPRFILLGSLKETGDPAGGMPGWVYNLGAEQEFAVNSFSDPGGGADITVDLTCSRKLESNKTYKFVVHDRVKGKNFGFVTNDQILEANETLLFNTQNNNVVINTTGRSTYTFKITKLSGDGEYYPSVTVTRPASRQLNFGWGHAEAESTSTVASGNIGGTITVTEHGTNKVLSNNQWVAVDSITIFTPNPADDYKFDGWFGSSDFSGSSYSTSDPMNMTVSNDGGTVNAFAKFTENSKTFSASTDNNWSTTANWSGGAAPTANEVAILQAPVNVDIVHAVAKRVIIDQNSHTGKLTIQPNKGLEVTGTIKKTTDGSSYPAPTAADLVLESSSAGNASLIFDNSNSAQATVQMYSKANIDNGTWNWQFMGIPFTTTKANPSYYGSYLYEWNNSGTWDEVTNGGTMTAFTGYCITQDAATTYVMSGTLNPTTSHEWTIPAGKEFVMANSWSAPIYVGAITNEALAVEKKTIYFFNTGHNETGAKAGTEAGTYVAVPIHAASYTGDSLIAPMQGFYVDNTGGSEGTVTLNYATVVRPAATRNDIVAGPMYAPKRGKVEEAQPDNRPTVLKLWANGAVYNDRVVLLEREGFSTGFDNGWDGKKLSFGEVGPSVYVINSLGEPEAVSAIPDLEGTVIGFRAGTNNTCTMTFEYDGDETFYINDLQAQQSALIDNESTYTFATDASDDEARFVISATPIAKTPTGVDTVTDNRSPLTVTKILLNGHIYIIRNGQVYGADGMLIK